MDRFSIAEVRRRENNKQCTYTDMGRRQAGPESGRTTQSKNIVLRESIGEPKGVPSSEKGSSGMLSSIFVPPRKVLFCFFSSIFVPTAAVQTSQACYLRYR